LAPLLTIGGWTGISNIISPLLTYLDRFIVGGLLTLQAVAFYVTAYDMVTRLSMLPLALMGAVFPVSSGLKLGDEQTARLFNACTRVLLFVSFCILFPLFILAEPVFSLWISPDFATHAAPIFKILCIGILFNMVAQAPVVFIFSVGHPKWLSVLHLIELPIFLTLIWWATSTYGVIGTAVAATTRYAIDALLVYEIARRKVIRKHFGFGADLGAVLTIFLLLLLGPLADTMFVQLALVLGGLCFFCWYTWSRLLSSDERNKLLLLLRRS
jgi:O-antigen/teichoic acid export membrane protein